MADTTTIEPPWDALSPIELRVVRLGLAFNIDLGTVADRLRLGIRTVSRYRSSIVAKLGAPDFEHVLRRAFAENLEPER